MAGAQGYGARLGLSALGDTSVTARLDFQSETLAVAEEFKDTTGLRGTRSRVIERVRAGIRRVRGGLVLQPTALEMANLLEWCLGGTPSGTSYPLGDTLAGRSVQIDRVAAVHTYSGVYVNQATLRASQGEPLTMELDLIGTDEVTSISFTPTVSIDTTTEPFMFHDAVLSIAGSTYNAREVAITVNNAIDGERFFNSQTLTQALPQDRQITVNYLVPYGDATALYNTGDAGVASTVTFTNGAVSLALAFVKVAFPRRSPTVPGRSEVMHQLAGTAYRSSTTLEVVTTLDSTP